MSRMTDRARPSIYDIECTDLKGGALPLRQFAGQPLLIVNTASLCGFSRQYKGLESLWQRYKDQGFVILAVPSNDFGQQEPGNSMVIASLCSHKFGVTFPVMQKENVSGTEAHPLFQWIAKEGGFLAKPRWNFYKYIIDREGHLVDWFSCLTPPSGKRFNTAIAKAMRKN